MPHLIETYALATGLKIDQPIPFENFFPIALDKKYIIVNASSGMPAKNYDYFNDVIRMVAPFLPDYRFVQIGTKDDVPLNGALHLHGLTTISQMMFLIRHCSLLIGNDSSAAHIASGYDKPLVSLFGATNAKIHGAYFGSKEKHRLIESHRNGHKPSYDPNEAKKTIGLIDPETVAQAVLDLLGVNHQLGIETVSIGDKYHAVTLELVLDQIIEPQDFPNIILNARMDYLYNESVLFHNLMLHRLCIITDRPFNVEILKRFRKNVVIVAYLIDSTDYDKGFADNMRKAGIPFSLVSTLEGVELGKAKLDFFDYPAISPRKILQKTDIENYEKISNNTLYRSNRFILSSGKIYLNKVDWKADKPRLNQNDNEATVIDDPSFWDDSDYFYIYNNVQANILPAPQP